MKRIRILVTAIALIMGITSSAYAVLPFDREQGLIVVGDRAYSIDYLTRLDSNMDIKAINDRISQNGARVYYMDTDGKIFNTSYMNSTPNTSERIFGTREILYTGASGQTLYILNDNSGKFEEKVIQATASVLSNQLGTLKMLKITLKNEDIKNLNDYEIGYYKLEDSSEMTPIGSSINYMINNARNTQIITIYSKDKRPIASGELDVSLTYGNTYKRGFNLNPISSGSSTKAVGNINNNGISDIDNDLTWTFYSNTGDKGALYKIKADGMDNILVCTDEAKFITVVGDWVYYSNYTDGGKLYKVKVDGTGREKICDDMASYINIVGDYAYYSNGTNGGKIYKINIKEDKSIRINTRKELTSDMAAFINVDKDKIYYSNYSDNRKIYTINTDGGSRVAIPDTQGAMFITIQGNDIYYTNYLEGGKIYRLAKGINTKTKISDDKTTSINVTGGEIYFTNYSDNKNIYKINKDGSQKTLMIKDSADYVTISGNTIFYSKAGKIFKVEYTVGADGQKVLGKPVAVTKSKDTNKIVKINNIIDNVQTKEEAQADKYKFPESVYAIMSDGSVKPVVVLWSKDKPSIKDNIYTYAGTVLGYNNKVTLTIGVTSSKALSINDILVTNNASENGPDTIEVRGVTKGDTIFVYNTEDITKSPIATGIASDGGSVVKMTTNLVKDGGSIWVTVLRVPGPKDKITPTQSVPVKVDYLPETNVPNHIAEFNIENKDGANDIIKFRTDGLQAGDVIKIYRTQFDKETINTEASGKVVTPGELIVERLDFSPDDRGGKNLWFSVTGNGKTESVRKSTRLPFDDAPSVKIVDACAKDNITSQIRFTTIGSVTETVGDVKNNFVLPVSYKESMVSWESDQTQYVTVSNSTALVRRPRVGEADVKVKVTPTFTKGRAFAKGAPIEVTIKAMTIGEITDSDFASLESQIEFMESDSKENVTQNILLPKKSVNGSDIAWAIDPTNNPGGKYAKLVDRFDRMAVNIIRPENGEGDKRIKLKATIGGVTKDIEILVKQQTGSMESLASAEYILRGKFDGKTIDTDTVNLSKTIDGQDGVVVEWEADYPIVIKVQGGIVSEIADVRRPRYTDGDKTDIKLTAKLSPKGQSTVVRKVEMTVKVKHQEAKDDEAVQTVANALSAYLVRNANVSNDNITSALYLAQDSTDAKIIAVDSMLSELDGTNGPKVTITWASSNEAIIKKDGTLAGGKGQVKMTATMESNKASATEPTKWTKTFIFEVK